MRLELITAYAVSLARVASWALAFSLVFRHTGNTGIAVLTLARGTLGLLGYGMLGLPSALIGILSKPMAAIPVVTIKENKSNILDYERKITASEFQQNHYFGMAISIAVGMVLPLLVLVYIYAIWFNTIHGVISYSYSLDMILSLGLGLVIRGVSDIYGSLLQLKSRITTDNLIALFAELVFMLGLIGGKVDPGVVGRAFLYSSTVLFGLRLAFSGGLHLALRLPGKHISVLMMAGLWVLLGQITDWFYAPVNNILIGRFDSLINVGYYSPAVQLDGALLLLVGGLSAVVFPKSALAFSAGNINTIRNYYVKGTLASLILLACGAVVISFCGKWILTRWFGSSFPITEAILPLVMIHTVIGGASSVGRSILMGIGKLKVYAISSILGGVCNAILAGLAVGVFHWGLKGIIYMTILTVTIRCAIWMPWYVLRTLRHEAGKLSIRSMNEQGTTGSI